MRTGTSVDEHVVLMLGEVPFLSPEKHLESLPRSSSRIRSTWAGRTDTSLNISQVVSCGNRASLITAVRPHAHLSTSMAADSGITFAASITRRVAIAPKCGATPITSRGKVMSLSETQGQLLARHQLPSQSHEPPVQVF